MCDSTSAPHLSSGSMYRWSLMTRLMTDDASARRLTLADEHISSPPRFAADTTQAHIPYRHRHLHIYPSRPLVLAGDPSSSWPMDAAHRVPAPPIMGLGKTCSCSCAHVFTSGGATPDPGRAVSTLIKTCSVRSMTSVALSCAER